MTDDIVTNAIAGNWHSVKVVVPPDTPFTLRDEEFYKPMNNDIVTRLRNSDGQGCTCNAYSYYECGCSEAVWAEMFITEAADEIERLRKERDHWMKQSKLLFLQLVEK